MGFAVEVRKLVMYLTCERYVVVVPRSGVSFVPEFGVHFGKVRGVLQGGDRLGRSIPL